VKEKGLIHYSVIDTLAIYDDWGECIPWTY